MRTRHMRTNPLRPGHLYFRLPNAKNHVDESLFSVCVVPLDIIWKGKSIFVNPKPSSPWCARTQRLLFEKETIDLITKAKSKFDNEATNLKPTEIQFSEKIVIIVTTKHFFTMIDGKICSALQKLATNRCYICTAGPSQLNNLEELKTLPIIQSALKNGLAPLHATIKGMELLLKIAYKIPYFEQKKNQTPEELQKIERAKKNENLQRPSKKAKVPLKAIDRKKAAIEIRKKQKAEELKKKKMLMEQTKLRIQTQLREEIGIVVDRVKPGYGSTNTGPVAKKFFDFPEKVSSLLFLSYVHLLLSLFTIYPCIHVLCMYDIPSATKFSSASKVA